MPTNRKVRLRKMREELTDKMRERLLSGHLWFMRASDDDEAVMRELWFQNREKLLRYWCQNPQEWKRQNTDAPLGYPEPGGPGSRPWGWWRFEAPPEPRRRIGGHGVSLREQPDCLEWERELSFGMPRYWASYAQGDPPQFESEVDYLKRHGLLTEEEERVLFAKRRGLCGPLYS